MAGNVANTRRDEPRERHSVAGATLSPKTSDLTHQHSHAEATKRLDFAQYRIHDRFPAAKRSGIASYGADHNTWPSDRVQTDSELILAVTLRNDHAAFGELVVRYEKLVWASVWKILQSYHATQDVTQEVFLVAHSQLHHLRNHDSLGSWLCRIAKREAVRVNHPSSTDLPIHDAVLEVTVPPAVSNDHSELISAVGGLPDHERVVIVLRYLNGHSLAEISELTDSPIGTVSKQISRALKRLRDCPGLQAIDKTVFTNQ